MGQTQILILCSLKVIDNHLRTIDSVRLLNCLILSCIIVSTPSSFSTIGNRTKPSSISRPLWVMSSSYIQYSDFRKETDILMQSLDRISKINLFNAGTNNFFKGLELNSSSFFPLSMSFLQCEFNAYSLISIIKLSCSQFSK